ncbi:hypothetical protein DDZ13_13525 [Coraliomargarita sinensis]|uniref:Uncharacterized protein n=1 Tax=Coraliomargarita sinensis TaxID=2174842 RepID=A0A317ZCZ2_9BACT|nr:hypothetical protein [Coraliomargarita sinensis]PXA03085.1 hypothetical protein DDZ13_13525 [Coraliomargarita sinensis]
MFRDRRYPAKLFVNGLQIFCTVLSVVLLTACGKGEFSSLESLPVDSYLKNPANFLGNTYLISAQIDSQIQWEEGVGRILAVETDGSTSRVPVFVPDGVGQNLHVGQRYEMRAIIRKGGLIYVEDLRKF